MWIRDSIEGMDDIASGKMVRAFVPLSEMFGYSTDLRSRTQDVVNTLCSLKNTNQYQRTYRKKYLLTSKKINI